MPQQSPVNTKPIILSGEIIVSGRGLFRLSGMASELQFPFSEKRFSFRVSGLRHNPFVNPAGKIVRQMLRHNVPVINKARIDDVIFYPEENAAGVWKTHNVLSNLILMERR